MRAMVVNAAQLATYSQAKQFLLSTRECIYTVHTIFVHILYTVFMPILYTLYLCIIHYFMCVGGGGGGI